MIGLRPHDQDLPGPGPVLGPAAEGEVETGRWVCHLGSAKFLIKGTVPMQNTTFYVYAEKT